MKLLVLTGDGIGPEIMAPTVAALETLNDRFGLDLDLEDRDIGFAALDRGDSALPGSVVEAAKNSDGVILGPVDTFSYPPAEDGGVNPSGGLRKALDLYANMRPSRSREGVPAMVPGMDLVVARENTEGIYADRNMFQGSGEFMPTEDLALSVRKISRVGSERIARAAFDLAQRRRRKVTVVHKANVLKMTDGLFLSVAREVGESYPDVAVEDIIVDAMTAHLIRRGADFDVVLTSNMYGDILSDEAAELSGGLGLGPSINTSDDHGIAQAAHGAAPDIAGRGIANPTALMLSVAMLLDWLGARHGRNEFSEASRRFEAAVDAVLADSACHTADLGGKATTREFGDAVLAAIVALETGEHP